jgi:hypothetical protein
MVYLNNRIVEISNDESETIIQEIRSNSKVFVVEIDGNKIASWNDYVSEIQDKFNFPTPCNDSVDRYLDWIRDLQWIEEDDIAIIINNYDEFLNKDPKLKNEIISDFNDVILPFWQEEVMEVVVEGQPKRFMLYLN